LLAGLDVEGCIVRRLDIPSLLLDSEALTLEEACVRTFTAAASHRANLFFLPRLDEWWEQTAIPALHPLRAALISCLRNLDAASAGNAASAGRCTIVLATSGCSASHFAQMGLHPFLCSFFHARFTTACRAPSKLSTLVFFTTLIKQSSMTLAGWMTEIADAAQERSTGEQPPGAQPSVSAPPPTTDTAETSIAGAPASSVDPRSPASTEAVDLPSWFSSQLPRVSAAVQELSARCLQHKCDFLRMQRIEQQVQRWIWEQMDCCRSALQSHSDRRASPSNVDPPLASILQRAASAQLLCSEVWEAALVALLARCQSVVDDAAAAAAAEQLATSEQEAFGTRPVTAAAAERADWSTMAQQHAGENRSRIQAQMRKRI